MPADQFKGKLVALEKAFTAYNAGGRVSMIRDELEALEGVVITEKALLARMKRMAVRRAMASVEGNATAAERARITAEATAALAGHGSEPLQRRKKLLQRAEQVWRALPKSALRSFHFYIELEQLALKYLALQFRVAQVTGDGDVMAEASESLKLKLDAMMNRAVSSAQQGSSSPPSPTPHLNS